MTDSNLEDLFDNRDEALGPDGMRLGEFPSYADYLQSEAWKILRSATLERDLDRCIDCGALAKEVHHKSYPRHVGETSLDDLVSLCRRCHDVRHRERALNSGREFAELTGRVRFDVEDF